MFNRKTQSNDMDAWVEERLSDYLDGILSPQERASVEAHLKQSERARTSLESLRWTMNLLKQTPAPALPRQFTLPVTQRAPAKTAPGWMVWALRGVAVAATAAFVILLTATLIRQNPANEAVLSTAAPVAPSAVVAMLVTPQPSPAAPLPASNNAQDSNTDITPRMITVAPPAPTTDLLPVTIVPAPKSGAGEPTQATNQAQDSAPSAAPSEVQEPTTVPVHKAQPTVASAAAGSPAGNTPEFNAESVPTENASTQRTIGVATVEGIVTAAQLKIRQGPGTDYRTLGVLKRGDKILAIGRSMNGAWFEIQFDKNNKTQQGWVAAQFIQLNGSADSLTFIEEPPQEPTETPTEPLPTETPTVTPPADEAIPTDVVPTQEAPATPTAEGNVIPPSPALAGPQPAVPARGETEPARASVTTAPSVN